MKVKSLLIATAGVMMLSATSEAALIAAFDFTGGTAASAAPAPLVYTAALGSATLYLDGTNGSSAFLTPSSSPEVTGFGGTTVNASTHGLSTTTTSPSALAIANSSANGKMAVFVFSMTDLSNLGISYSTQGTGTGFTTQTWSYSTDGETFTEFAVYNRGSAATTFASVGVVTLDTSALSVLDNVATVYIGVTFSGATNASGNNRLDNIVFETIPEPASALFGAIGLLGILRRRR